MRVVSASNLFVDSSERGSSGGDAMEDGALLVCREVCPGVSRLTHHGMPQLQL